MLSLVSYRAMMVSESARLRQPGAPSRVGTVRQR